MILLSVNNFSVRSNLFLGGNQHQAMIIKCLAQGHNTMPIVILEPGTLISCRALHH